MPLTWDQFGNLGLTAAQKTKLQQAAAIGAALGTNVNPDISAVTPAQAKAVAAFARDVNTLLGPAFRGAHYILKKVEGDAAKAAKDAIPSGSL